MPYSNASYILAYVKVVVCFVLATNDNHIVKIWIGTVVKIQNSYCAQTIIENVKSTEIYVTRYLIRRIVPCDDICVHMPQFAEQPSGVGARLLLVG